MPLDPTAMWKAFYLRQIVQYKVRTRNIDSLIIYIRFVSCPTVKVN